MKQVEFFAVNQAYESVYRECIAKYFLFSKTGSENRDFFSSLAKVCEMLLQQVRNLNYQQIRQSKALKNAVVLGGGKRVSFHEVEAFRENFSKCMDVFSKRKKLFDEAYLLGYRCEKDRACSLENENLKEDEKPHDKCFLSMSEVASFFKEIAGVLNKNEAYDVILSQIKQLFQKYHIPFTLN